MNHSVGLILHKSTSGAYLSANEYAKVFYGLGTLQDLTKTNDQYWAENLYHSEHYSTEELLCSIEQEDRKALNGQALFSLKLLFIHNVPKIFLTHKSPIILNNQIQAIRCHYIECDPTLIHINTRLCQANQIYVSELTKKLIQHHFDTKVPLTVRERQCLKLLSRGFSIKKIAMELSLSQRTVEHYLENARARLNCLTTYELVARYTQDASKCVVYSKADLAR